jgi:nitrate reductase NapAB chaperone NapD
MTVKFHEMKNLVSPTISIDEYKPKIGEANETVVVAFEVASEQPAKDLSNLIETDVTENLDVDISQGPNSEGKFLVFVEFARDKKLHEKIVKIAKTVSNVADINEWKFTYYKGDKELELNEDNLGEAVVNDKNEYVIRFRDESSEETTNEEIDRIRQLAGLQ